MLMVKERRAAHAAAERRTEATSERAAILAEAISLGYALGEDFRKAAPDGGPNPDAAEPDGEEKPARRNGGGARRTSTPPH
jgi:hypothetical protein